MSRVQSSASSVQRPESSVQSPASRVQSPASRVQHSESSVQSLTSRIRRPESRVQHPESSVQLPESSVQLLRPESRNSGMPICTVAIKNIRNMQLFQPIKLQIFWILTIRRITYYEVFLKRSNLFIVMNFYRLLFIFLSSPYMESFIDIFQFFEVYRAC